MKQMMSGVQQLGRALMLPIAVLPAAALLLRLGQPDWLDLIAPDLVGQGDNAISMLHATLPFIGAAGGALFSQLGILFAIGVAVGFAREGHGAAALAGVVAYFVTLSGAEALLTVPPGVLAGVPDGLAGLVANDYRDGLMARVHVPVGIICGATAGMLYNRYANIALPEYLAFFGGRRFVPIAAAVAGLGYALLLGLTVEAIVAGMEQASRAILDAGGIGLFVYGLLNRLLIVTGLHHIINNLAWFQVGDFQGAAGDLNRFFAGDPEAGGFMSGFFPVMMFGLPAACYAMYRQARPERRKEVGGMLGSMALTSFLTGVTEPIEFTFMFLAPALFALHAVLTGIAMALMDVLQVKLGFGFSAGLFDYVINFGDATNPLLLIPVGLAYAAIYYFVFSFAIRWLDLKTPGREPAAAGIAAASGSTAAASGGGLTAAAGFVVALGGAGNLVSIGACTTRLRLEIKKQDLVDEAALRALGAKGFVRPSANTLQVIIGPTAERVADEIRAAMSGPVAATAPAEIAGSAKTTAGKVRADLPKAIAHLLAGPAGLGAAWLAGANRLIVESGIRDNLDTDALAKLGVYAVKPAGDAAVSQFLIVDDALRQQVFASASVGA
ncbi:PTS N-acetyl-D-glucosamine transporter [Maricaulis sp. W15]|uniref:N-acetylglucosamine-specific PTS transporter subunit IIBC n=1 Tax=Maricaulis sp. W15 TaxID=1772333 RepID=UPI000948F580|nr:N-acetylglucosamine-specific PTS transporter subunit IIBC [Maricaulis sp. W15]OLF73893.1 PTS N-acetyl-D-glucosamine transporter [Maricaulis sp. W15]